MLRFDDDSDTGRPQRLHQRVGDLDSKVLLDLEPAREHVHNARHFRQTDDFSIWNVGDVRFPYERQEMMLTHGVKLDVLHQHDLARLGIEDRVVNQSVEALAVTRRQKIEGACRAVWRSPQSLTLGILADGFEQATE